MLATCNLQCIHLKVRIPNTTSILFLLNFLPILSLFHISINLSHICLPYQSLSMSFSIDATFFYQFYQAYITWLNKRFRV
jgi:hypothetical protein